MHVLGKNKDNVFEVKVYCGSDLVDMQTFKTITDAKSFAQQSERVLMLSGYDSNVYKEIMYPKSLKDTFLEMSDDDLLLELQA